MISVQLRDFVDGGGHGSRVPTQNYLRSIIDYSVGKGVGLLPDAVRISPFPWKQPLMSVPR